jgi:hypothetical protein
LVGVLDIHDNGDQFRLEIEACNLVKINYRHQYLFSGGGTKKLRRGTGLTHVRLRCQYSHLLQLNKVLIA